MAKNSGPTKAAGQPTRPASTATPAKPTSTTAVRPESTEAQQPRPAERKQGTQILDRQLPGPIKDIEAHQGEKPKDPQPLWTGPHAKGED
jgi:hypothetical protein